MNWPILSVLTFLPLIGAVLIALLRGDEASVARNARWLALWTSGLTFLVSLWLLVAFDGADAGFQLIESVKWLSIPMTGDAPWTIGYKLGIDGISLWFVLLSTFLTPICVLASWEAIEKRVRDYMIAFLILETMMIGMFCALDLIVFYVFFEGVLIPMFLIIGVWGGARRVYASFKLFLYTLLGSVLMLVAVLWLFAGAGTTDMVAVLETPVPPEAQTWLWLCFFASFAVKMPMWPVHTWLPDAHVEAPTAGSVILAGVLLKMGGYGMLRFLIPLFPDASHFYQPFVFGLSVVAIVYTSLVALAQTDMKKMIAYSSVAHMGYVTLGLFTFNLQGIQGAMFQMLSHGVVSAALFLCVGVVYDRLHTRDIARYGGVASTMPHYALVFAVFMLASVGLPGTGGFVGEFLVLTGVWAASYPAVVFAASGIVLGATYMLWLYRKVVFGEIRNEEVRAMPDLGAREIVIFAPLVVLVVVMGVQPNLFLAPMEKSVQAVTQIMERHAPTPPSAPVAAAPVAAAPAATPAAAPAPAAVPAPTPAAPH